VNARISTNIRIGGKDGTPLRKELSVLTCVRFVGESAHFVQGPGFVNAQLADKL
jgi:hypothetical protein